MKQERPLVAQLPQGGSISRQRGVVSKIFNKSKQMDSGSFIETLPDLLLKYPLITYIPVVDVDNVKVYYHEDYQRIVWYSTLILGN